MQTSVDFINADIIKRRLGSAAGHREISVLQADDVRVSPARDYPGCKLVQSGVLGSSFVYQVRENRVVL